MNDQPKPPAPIEIRDIDKRIWEEELDGFVPQKIFDAHTHSYRWAFNTDPNKNDGPYYNFAGKEFAEADWQMLNVCDELMMPGREVHRLSFGFPFSPDCDFEASNRFIAEQTSKDPESAGLMLVRPEITADEISHGVKTLGLLGLKPYRFYSSTGDAVNCRITDFLPEHQLEVANQYGLLVMMHLSKPNAIADEENLADLQYLTTKYPRVRWILAHCARSYFAGPLERAAPVLKELPNVWFDTSSVCESDAITALCKAAGPERVMYGSDDVPVGVMRGKYVAFGFGWAYLSEDNHSLNLSHCNPNMTFTRYEQLRAMRRAAIYLELSAEQIGTMFYTTAANLIADVRSDVHACK